MMLEALFAHRQQQQAFLLLVAGGMALGVMLHLGTLLRRMGMLRGLWDALTAAGAAAVVFLAALRYQSGLRAYAALGLLLGILLYMAGVFPLVHAIADFFRKAQKNRRPKAGETTSGDESSVQRQKGEVKDA